MGEGQYSVVMYSARGHLVRSTLEGPGHAILRAAISALRDQDDAEYYRTDELDESVTVDKLGKQIRWPYLK